MIPAPPHETMNLKVLLFVGIALASLGVGAYFVFRKKPTDSDEIAEEPLTSSSTGSSTATKTSVAKESTTTKQQAPPSKFPSNATIKGSGIRIRFKPDTSSTIYKTMENGQEITLDGQVTGQSVSGSTIWYKVRTANGTRYIHSSLVTNFKTLVEKGAGYDFII